VVSEWCQDPVDYASPVVVRVSLTRHVMRRYQMWRSPPIT
jgi:hypothetical protein